MLFHQLAVLFYAPALFMFWKKRRDLSLYVTISAGLTAIAYALAFVARTGAFNAGPFLAWVTSYSPDVAFSFNIPRNLLVSFRGWTQLFLNGRPSLLDLSNVLTILLLALCAGALVSLMIALARRSGWRITIYHPALFRFSLMWIVSYAVFLIFWLPHNTFYKLFALPAIILLIASCIEPGSIPKASGAALPLVTLVALINLTFAILPYSRVTSNQAVAFAFDLHKSLANGIVYFRTFATPDNWFARYFNPATQWKYADSTVLIEQDLRNGRPVWLETTALDYFSNADKRWLETRIAGTERRELVNSKHRIRFVRLILPTIN
jgi:hypothetical protein